MRSAKIFYTVKLDSFLLMLAKWYFLSLTLLVLTACGSSSNSDDNNPQPTLQTLAIEKIADYAQNGGTEPSLQDYTDAGVTGVTASNLVTINTTVAGLSEADVDTQAEIQALADNLVIVIPNIAPTATADTIEAVENITITFDVLGNDTDVDGTLDKTSVTINTAVSNGSTSINPTTGEISYSPAADYSGADSFAYTVQDDDGLASNEVTVSITVDVDTDNDGTGNKQDLDDDGDGFSDLDEIAAATDPLDANSTPAVTPPTPIPPIPPTPMVNNAPKANADSVNAVENQLITFDVLNNDTDTDGSLNKTSVRINTAVSNGTTSINPSTGEITYTPTADYSGTDSLAYTVQDNKGLVSNEATVSILVDVDTDGNGIGNTQDLDDDGDGFSDVDEIAAGTDPLNPNSKPTLTAKQIAIEKIANYAQNGTPAPTLQDYLDAGITGIDSNNLVAMNTAVEALSKSDADTEAEIQAVADSLVPPLAAPSIANTAAQIYMKGSLITPLTITNNGGGELSSCSTTPLPVGLSIAVSTDNSTCEITGTPTAEQSATIYTITATNSAGNDTATVSIEVSANTANVIELVKDLSPIFRVSSFPQRLTKIGNALYFLAYSPGDLETTLWKSNGNNADTILLKTFPTALTSRTKLVAVGDTLFLNINDGVKGLELWTSNGTPEGTVLVKDTYPGARGSVTELTVYDGAVYFACSTSNLGTELWKSDGTSIGTQLVKNIYADQMSVLPNSSFPDNLTVMADSLFFIATDGGGRGLWKTRGTEGSTVIVKNFDSFNDSETKNLIAVGDTLYLSAPLMIDGNRNGNELWKSDGTNLGTFPVKDINTTPISNFVNESAFRFTLNSYFTAVGDILYFVANNGRPPNDGNGAELWKSDGTKAGTTLVKDIFATDSGFASSRPEDLVAIGNTLYFIAIAENTGLELWKSDGTEAGTVLLKDTIAGSTSGFIRKKSFLTAAGNNLYFSAANSLWVSDGTTAGTVKLSNEEELTEFRYLTLVGDTLFFAAQDDDNGNELWKLKIQ